MPKPRTQAELVDVDDPAWPELEDSIKDSQVPVEVISIAPDQGRTVLHQLQVTARSTLGALALNTGGLLIDDGWLRILGGGGQDLPSLATANNLDSPSEASGSPSQMTVAFDVLGGQFAIDGGGLDVEPGKVCYWAPDTLKWSSLGVGHTAFVEWALSEDGLVRFYEDMRWEGWRDEVKVVAPSQGIALYPPLFSAEAYPLVNTSRRAVPFDEILGVNKSMADQLTKPANHGTYMLP
ncbi:hypothetical protein K4F52_001869 [Lecanicillium sp. MT-2017a]|nr:hypothetical protein K4F52_001869 [Lecanicillium sp. MT-2017a]